MRHAVTIVGVRIVVHEGGLEREDLRFLVQNWWPCKQFFEVDCRFLASCDTIAHVITSHGFTAWPNAVPTRERASPSPPSSGLFVQSAFGGKETLGVKETVHENA